VCLGSEFRVALVVLFLDEYARGQGCGSHEVVGRRVCLWSDPVDSGSFSKRSIN
jgi:hypothetical protein